MPGETLALVIMGALLVATNAFWAMLTSKLINKLMSRSYYEYVQAQELKTPKPLNATDPEMNIDPIDQKQAQEMNSLVGIV